MKNIKIMLGTTLWSIVMLICIPIVLLSFKVEEEEEVKEEVKVEQQVEEQDLEKEELETLTPNQKY
ncbi:hypothetical protein [Flammeovirga sp. SJP92]|uniref:hypothetical protein n=1 Tax=Flammeovirga sp. SJP92 TaxID=1775430 RepID=UPI000788FD6F|nr:hypothetical protein [Flammeovirga sp. SJP92]KXX71395.1 hypothetical protein AVL50_05700 [Flammeovirga sp. SJP92]